MFVLHDHRGSNWGELDGAMDREALIEVCDDGTYSIRIAHEGWGVVGPRMLRGEKELPVYEGLDFEGAKEAIGVWNEFLGRQGSVKSCKKRKR